MGKEALKEEDNQGKGLEEKLPYPKAVFFIATNEFCERFCYYGMRTVLSLYLTEYLLYSESDAKVIYHTFIMLAYFFPIFGGMIADGFLGKYRTILYISMIYAIGNVILSMAAITPLGLPHREFSLLGLFLIACGTGGIKPCVLPLGGDQFILPQQEVYMAQFFAIFYFAVNLGSLLSTIITPILREDVHCFGEDSCFPFAFGLPSILMITAITIIILGKPFIKIVPPEGSLLYKVTACMCHSIKMHLKSRSDQLTHWLDYSKQKYGEKLVEDIKRTVNVLYMFLPMPIFWALVDQIGSTWTFQARRMNGDIGFYTILPDQMQFANPLLYLSWIPISEYFLYPAFHKLKILRTTLQKITCGGMITALGFLCSAFVSLAGSFFLATGDYYKNIDIQLSGNKTFPYILQSNCANYSDSFKIYEEKSVGYYFDGLEVKFFEDNVSKDLKGLPQVRTLINSAGEFFNITYKNNKGATVLTTNSSDYSLHSLHPDVYQIIINNNNYEYKFSLGGVYAVLAIPNSKTTFEINIIEVTQPNSVHMLWLAPQYIFLTLGELMFSVPGVEFAYSQAPISMKSLVMSCWLLTTTVGNLIVILIEAAAIFERASYNAFLYTGMMVIAMFIFAIMAMRYKYMEIEKSSSDVDETKDSTQNSA